MSARPTWAFSLSQLLDLVRVVCRPCTSVMGRRPSKAVHPLLGDTPGDALHQFHRVAALGHHRLQHEVRAGQGDCAGGHCERTAMPGLGQRRSTRTFRTGHRIPRDPTSRSLAARGPGVPPVAEHRSHHRLHHHQLCSSAVVGGGALRPPRCLVHDLDEDASVDEDLAEGEGEQGRNVGDVAACGMAAMVRRMTDSRPRSYRGRCSPRGAAGPHAARRRGSTGRARPRSRRPPRTTARHAAGATTMVRGWASTPSSRSCSRSRRTKYAGRLGGAAWSAALAHQCHHHDKVRIVTQAPTSRTRNPLFGDAEHH